MAAWEAIRNLILATGWPVLIVGSAYVLSRARQFSRSMGRNVVGRLVVGMTIGWLVTMYSLGVIATAFMWAEPQKGVPVVLPIFVVWFATMTVILWASTRWGKEAATLHGLYGRLEQLVDRRTAELEGEVRHRRSTQRELALSARRLKQSNEDLERFAFIASHDLQAPLRSIRLSLQALEERHGEAFDAESREHLEFAIQGAKRMRDLIVDLLAYSRVTHEAADSGLIAARDVLDEALADLHPLLERVGALVTHDVLPDVSMNRTHLRSIFENLVGNAAKFHAKGQAPRIHVGVRRDRDDIVFCVRDNGIGIPPERRGKLFQMFERLHSQREYPGTGIGLALCKRVAELYGGRIWVESRPGEGSTFYFAIPQQAHAEVDPPRSPVHTVEVVRDESNAVGSDAPLLPNGPRTRPRGASWDTVSAHPSKR